jgi:uncharacterized SAM-binding protein YcdF (DUF218 family)
MRWLLRIGGAIVLVAVLAFSGIAADIALYSRRSDPGPADAAVVLGAAVLGRVPSPVFAERLRHAVELYKAGTVRKIVVSGGLAPGDALSEAVAGRDWIVAEGVPAADVLTEDQSHTTRQNIANVAPVLAANGLHHVLVVSDPLHMQRAMAMADGDHMDAAPSPTPTTRFQSFGTEAPMLMTETWSLIAYWLTGS